MVKVIYILSLISFSFAITDVYPDPTPGSTPIQDAIDDAIPGETIIVHDGTYTENLLIEKDLTLRSENGTLEDGDGYWHAPNEGATNETLFSTRGGGFRNGTGSGHYLYMGLSNYYWTSTEFSNNDVWYRRLNSGSAGFLRVYWDGGFGYSVRCIQD